jgi:hypothetical protein
MAAASCVCEPMGKHEHTYVVRTLNDAAREAGWKATDKGGRDYWWRISRCATSGCLSQYTEGDYEPFPDRPAIGELLVVGVVPDAPDDEQQLTIEEETDPE